MKEESVLSLQSTCSYIDTALSGLIIGVLAIIADNAITDCYKCIHMSVMFALKISANKNQAISIDCWQS